MLHKALSVKGIKGGGSLSPRGGVLLYYSLRGPLDG